MFFELDFADKSEGLYTMKGAHGGMASKVMEIITPFNMLTTDPDLEAYATTVPQSMFSAYTPFKLDDVLNGKMSVEILKKHKHYILVDQWELSAFIKKVHTFGFEFSFSGGSFFVKQFSLGEPVE